MPNEARAGSPRDVPRRKVNVTRDQVPKDTLQHNESHQVQRVTLNLIAVLTWKDKP
jgi:hypothetical protein